jgi:hypothetical protein
MATLEGKEIPYLTAIVPDVGGGEGGGVPRLNRLKPREVPTPRERVPLVPTSTTISRCSRGPGWSPRG